MRQVTHQAETYPGFRSMKRLACVIPSIKFAGTHLYTWVMRGTVRINKSRAQKSKAFFLFINVKTITKLNLENINKFETKIKKISRCGSRSPDNAKFGHFTLLFCRERQRNVQRIITHVHSHCSAH